MMSSGTRRTSVKATTPAKPPMRPPYQVKPMPPNSVAPEVGGGARPVLGHVVEAGAGEAADARRDDELVGELGRDAAAPHQRHHDDEAGHDERQGRHEAEAVEGEVADLEEDGAHGPQCRARAAAGGQPASPARTELAAGRADGGPARQLPRELRESKCPVSGEAALAAAGAGGEAERRHRLAAPKPEHEASGEAVARADGVHGGHRRRPHAPLAAVEDAAGAGGAQGDHRGAGARGDQPAAQLQRLGDELAPPPRASSCSGPQARRPRSRPRRGSP